VPLFYQQNINEHTRLALWEIKESADFFLRRVPLPAAASMHPHKKLQHLAGRFLLTELFPDFPMESIRIADTRKPFLPDERYHFSISHAGDMAAAIVSSNRRVGIDVEHYQPRILRIAHKFLHPDERAMVDALEPVPENQVPVLILLWSVKETLYKWLGRGEVDFSDHLRVEAFTPAAEGQLLTRIVMRDVDQPLTVHYRMLDHFCFSWTME
jgi:phosphopantetheinyl transferase